MRCNAANRFEKGGAKRFLAAKYRLLRLRGFEISRRGNVSAPGLRFCVVDYGAHDYARDRDSRRVLQDACATVMTLIVEIVSAYRAKPRGF